MPRRKLLPDSDVLTLALDRLTTEGERAVTFGAMAEATGLAASTLVQRFGSQEAMVEAALLQGWDRAMAMLGQAEAEAPKSPKGVQALLKSLPAQPVPLSACLPRAACRDRAALWRLRVEAALALRLGGGAKAAQSAAMIFAYWQGQAAWMDTGGPAARVKDVLKRLT
ncbi:MAG: transcriptional regulator [Pseudorhodobacter sp.]